MFFIPPEQKATYIMEEHTHLYLFRSSPPCLQTQILQSFSQFVFFGQPQNIIVKLQGIQHSQINSDCNCRCAFFYSGHSQQRTGGTFCEPIQSVLLQSTSSAPIFEAVWFPLYSLSYLYLFKVQSDRADNFTIVNLSYNMQRWRF